VNDSDDEVTSSHPFTEVMEAATKAGTCVSMTLQPLTRHLIATLLVDAIACSAEDPRTQRLAHLCWTKTHGNPFFVIELIRSLYQQGNKPTSQHHPPATDYYCEATQMS
jgi:predicted ATPase